MPDQKQEILVVNRQPHQIKLVLEPWANEIVLRPGTTAVVSIEEAKPDEKLELVLCADRIELWATGKAYLHYDGETL